MGSIVIELQRESLDSNQKVADILRKALLVSRKLGVVDFQKWVSSELNGYESDQNLPQYRYVTGYVKAHNPYHGWIPVVIDDPEIATIAKRQRVTQSIGELESLIGNDPAGIIKMQFNAKLESHLMKGMNVQLQPILHVGINQMVSIVDIVRSTVLEWTLRLEEEGLMGEGFTFSNIEKMRAKRSDVINIHNFQGVFGDITNSDVSQGLSLTIGLGDSTALAQYLKSIDVTEEDVQDVIQLLEQEEKPSTPNHFGPKVGKWIGDMVGKAASGVWKIAVGSAGDLLTKAISAYYGLG